MAAGSSSITPSLAQAWLRSHPDVGAASRRDIAVPGKATPDAVLEDPTRLVAVFKRAVIEAVQMDAPPGVAEELLGSLRSLTARVGRIERYGYLGTQLAGLQGLRDAAEIVPALRESVLGAPDEASRVPLERLVAVADRAPVFLGPDGTDTSESVPGTTPDTTGGEFVPLGTTEPRTTQPRTTDTGSPTTDTSAPDRAAVLTAEQVLADAGAQLGREFGQSLDVVDGADTGAALGAQYAVSVGMSYGASGTGSDLSGTSASSRFWGIVGGAVGFGLGGPFGAAAGYLFGSSYGASGSGAASAHMIGSAIETMAHAIDPLLDVTTLTACLLCGEACIPCVLAAEAGH